MHELSRVRLCIKLALEVGVWSCLGKRCMDMAEQAAIIRASILREDQTDATCCHRLTSDMLLRITILAF